MLKVLTSYQLFKSVEDMFTTNKKRKKFNFRTTMCRI